MSRRHIRMLVLLLPAGLAAHPASAQKPNPSAKTELVVGSTDFQQLRWIVGSWRVEGEGQPAQYERYRFIDDSTLTRESFADSRFRALRSTTRYELRGNRVRTRTGNAQWIVTGLDSASAAFRAVAEGSNDFVWQRHDHDEWIAVHAWPPSVDHPARTVTYHMKRVKGS